MQRASGLGVERQGALTAVEASLDPPGASCQLSSGDKEPTTWETQSERIACNSQPAVRRVCAQCVLPSLALTSVGRGTTGGAAVVGGKCNELHLNR